MYRRFTIVLALALLGSTQGCGYISQMSQSVTCKTCKGKGLCWWCGGSGNAIFGGKDSTCDGNGRCKDCAGVGYTVK